MKWLHKGMKTIWKGEKPFVLVPFQVREGLRDVLVLTPTEYERGIKRGRKVVWLHKTDWKPIKTSSDAWISEKKDRIVAVGYGFRLDNKEWEKRPHTVFTYPIHKEVKRIKTWRFPTYKEAKKFAKKMVKWFAQKRKGIFEWLVQGRT